MNNSPVSKRPSNSTKSPQFFTPVEMQSVLNWTKQCEPDLLAYVALRAFSGARRREVEHLDSKDINLVGRIIKINAERSSMSSTRRYLRISDNLAAWLSLCLKAEGPVIDPKVAKSLHRRCVALCVHAGIPDWPKYVLRHSFAVHHLVLANDIESTMCEMGLSSGALWEEHFRAPVTLTEAKAYFDVYPLGHSLAIAPLTLVSQAPVTGGRKPAELVP